MESEAPDSPHGWTPQEDELLKSGVRSVGPRNWKAIALEFLGGRRTDVQCLHRWQKVLRPGLVKGPWTEEEDRIIVECMSQGIRKWSEIAARIPGRLGKQCRERWVNHLDPSISKNAWSLDEDARLVALYAQFGTRWKIISEHMPGRSENAVKNRWNSMRRKRSRQGDVAEKEEGDVTASVEEGGGAGDSATAEGHMNEAFDASHSTGSEMGFPRGPQLGSGMHSAGVGVPGYLGGRFPYAPGRSMMMRPLLPIASSVGMGMHHFGVPTLQVGAHGLVPLGGSMGSMGIMHVGAASTGGVSGTIPTSASTQAFSGLNPALLRRRRVPKPHLDNAVGLPSVPRVALASENARMHRRVLMRSVMEELIGMPWGDLTPLLFTHRADRESSDGSKPETEEAHSRQTTEARVGTSMEDAEDTLPSSLSGTPPAGDVDAASDIRTKPSPSPPLSDNAPLMAAVAAGPRVSGTSSSDDAERISEAFSRDRSSAPYSDAPISTPVRAQRVAPRRSVSADLEVNPDAPISFEYLVHSVLRMPAPESMPTLDMLCDQLEDMHREQSLNFSRQLHAQAAMLSAASARGAHTVRQSGGRAAMARVGHSSTPTVQQQQQQQQQKQQQQQQQQLQQLPNQQPLLQQQQPHSSPRPEHEQFQHRALRQRTAQQPQQHHHTTQAPSQSQRQGVLTTEGEAPALPQVLGELGDDSRMIGGAVSGQQRASSSRNRQQSTEWEGLAPGVGNESADFGEFGTSAGPSLLAAVSATLTLSSDSGPAQEAACDTRGGDCEARRAQARFGEAGEVGNGTEEEYEGVNDEGEE